MKKPNLDYPYLSIPDIDEEDIEYKPKDKESYDLLR
jgi:hypothetical protein